MHAVIDKYESDVTAMLKGQQAKGPREVKKKMLLVINRFQALSHNSKTTRVILQFSSDTSEY